MKAGAFLFGGGEKKVDLGVTFGGVRDTSIVEGFSPKSYGGRRGSEAMSWLVVQKDFDEIL